MTALIVVAALLCAGQSLLLADPAGELSHAQANQWLWQADNHARAEQWETSKFTDGASEFQISCQGDASWCWDDPYPGAVTFRQTNGWMAGNVPSRGFANSSDFGEAFDIDKGITVAARVWPIHAHSGGTLCLSAANRSTQDLPGKSTYVWVGWAVPDEVRFYNSQNKCLKRFKASVDYDDRWSVWSFSAKQVGDSVAWDLWIDNVHQAADQPASDGTRHTLVHTEQSASGNTVRFGQRAMMLYPNVTVWDYVAVTNAGVIPGWTGPSTLLRTAPVREPEQPAALTDERKNELLRLAVFKEYMKADALLLDRRHSDAIASCEKALEKYSTADPGLKIVLWLGEIRALTALGKHEKALQLCDELLAKHAGKFDAHHLDVLRSLKVAACDNLGRVDDAASVVDDMIAALDASISALLNPALANPGFEEVADGNDAPGCAWYCRAEAGFRSETSNPHSGSRCLVFTNASGLAPEVYARLYQVVHVLPGTKYELSLWVRGEDVAPGDHLTDWASYQLDFPSGSFAWRKVSTTFTTKDGQGSLNLGVNVVNKCKALAIDDISLRAAGTPAQVKPMLEQNTGLALQMGDAFFHGKKYREAAEAYKEVMKADGASPDYLAKATYQLALCYEKSGLARSARVYMLRVTEKYPGTDAASQARGMLYLWDTYGAPQGAK
jgi:tetratricopeptide (TPR) repeat protein